MMEFFGVCILFSAVVFCITMILIHEHTLDYQRQKDEKDREERMYNR